MSSNTSRYGNGLVIIQDRHSSSSSSYSRPSSAYSASSTASRSSSSYSGFSYSSSSGPSMNSSSNRSSGTSGYSERYRTGSSSNYYADVKETTPRSGNSVVVVHHYRPNTATDEPRSGDYYSSGSSSNRSNR